jgi:hypothetical protein
MERARRDRVDNPRVEKLRQSSDRTRSTRQGPLPRWPRTRRSARRPISPKKERPETGAEDPLEARILSVVAVNWTCRAHQSTPVSGMVHEIGGQVIGPFHGQPDSPSSTGMSATRADSRSSTTTTPARRRTSRPKRSPPRQSPRRTPRKLASVGCHRRPRAAPAVGSGGVPGRSRRPRSALAAPPARRRSPGEPDQDLPPGLHDQADRERLRPARLLVRRHRAGWPPLGRERWPRQGRRVPPDPSDGALRIPGGPSRDSQARVSSQGAAAV